MVRITTPPARRIITDFAHEIRRRRTKGPKPAKTVINFRNDRGNGIERDIYHVPVDLIRYRKDNGRITSEVLHYEKNRGLLKEDANEGQKAIRSFLQEKDKDKTEELTATMSHEGQREAAIITCDGFLINGNRRKMVLEELKEQYPGDPRFEQMKVVILPGEGEPGGPPTLLEIEQIENRYQLQSDGKAEYSSFDRALSIRRKVNIGMSVEEQLRDDSTYAGLSEKKFKDAVRQEEEKYLKPLEAIDRYLDHLGRNGLYMSVSEGIGDPEGRWQAFLDYYKCVYKKLADEKQRLKLRIAEQDVGKIEDVAFTLIRQRHFPGMDMKLHKIMRDLGKWISKPESKKALLKLVGDVHELGPKERLDENGKELEPRDEDVRWSKENQTAIIRQVKKAKGLFERQHEQETPINLLRAALAKLNHEDMDIESLSILKDADEARNLATQIQERAQNIEHEIYECKKELKRLTNHFRER